ncbi:MAG: tRNA (adenosine(37)-N6)-threonylcarbamoyltransferase complex dimerization subunit type 1 TsaB [Steroidobacteraceae bacterium]
MKVLALDTSTEACSAAIRLDDGTTFLRHALTERSHADLILPMVDEVLREVGLKLRQLDGLAFGRGPGGFTGLRIAAGVVQGLAYGAGLQVAPVSSLAAVAYLCSSGQAPQGTRRAAGDGILVCNDARMSELYWACFRFDAGDPATPLALTAERVSAPQAVEPAAGVAHCAGNGLARYPELRARFEATGLQVHADIYPRADAVAALGAAMLARGEGVEPALAVPTYVRDDVARPPSGSSVTGMS